MLIIFASLFSLLSEIPSDGWTAGNAKGFMGLFSHQNSLGAILLFTFPGWLYLHLLIEDKKASEDSGKFSFLFRYTYPRSFKYFFAAGFVLNILLLTLTHSRASILFLFVMLSLYLFLLYRKNVKRLAIGSALLILMFFSVSAVNPVLVKNSLLGNSEKAATNIQEEQVPPKLWGKTWYSFWYKGDDTPYSTRQHIFADSWKAAQIGGLFGIGYGISHPNIKNNAAGSRFDESGRYIREKGNSFLAMVEEVGGVGLGLFLLPVFFFFRFFFYNSGELFSYPKLSIFLLLILFTHAQFEAWMTGVHSPLLFVYICLSASFQTQSYLLLE
ncbi:MAG: O-antigen ligase family protein [Ignavibacteriales bacterium]|nr:MAG: O-antigen ligase family protein [Ignavibacteriales bacterium]